MSQELEIEFKNMVSETDFKRLVDTFQLQLGDFPVQHNHYFDTEAFLLKQAGCALRIREKNGMFELTLKEPATDGLLETNEKISCAVAETLLTGGAFPDGPVKQALQYFKKKMGSVFTLLRVQENLYILQGVKLLEKKKRFSFQLSKKKKQKIQLLRMALLY